MESRKMRGVGMCGIGTDTMLVGHLEKRDYLEDLDVDWWIILRILDLQEMGWEGRTGLI